MTQIDSYYEICKDEINTWLSNQSWWYTYSDVISAFIDRLKKAVIWEKDYLINFLKPKLQKDFEQYGLPYLESLAEHYVDNKLPFHNELMEKIINDNIDKMIEEVYRKLSSE
jgi:hypothetical protein